MSVPQEFIQGEHSRTLDERFRVSLPAEWVEPLGGHDGRCMLVKERAGCLSLWPAATWHAQMDASIDLLKAKMRAGKFDGRTADVQSLGRLLSTRHTELQLAGRGRLLVPEGFREFLHVEPGGDVMVVGAAVCVELWNPEAWRAFLSAEMPNFGSLFHQLAS